MSSSEIDITQSGEHLHHAAHAASTSNFWYIAGIILLVVVTLFLMIAAVRSWRGRRQNECAYSNNVSQTYVPLQDRDFGF